VVELNIGQDPVLHQTHADEDQVHPYTDDLLWMWTGMSDYSNLFGGTGIQERQLEVVKRQLEVMEQRSGPFRLNLTTDDHLCSQLVNIILSVKI